MLSMRHEYGKSTQGGVLARYVWLPMSVRDRRNKTAEQDRSWGERVGSALGIAQRPSVDVVVRWEDAWQPLSYYAASQHGTVLICSSAATAAPGCI